MYVISSLPGKLRNSVFVKVIVIMAVVAVIHACKDDDDDDPAPQPSADQLLYNAVVASGYSYFQGGAILPGVSPSPHGSFKLRFNATAAAALDSTGELPTGGSFPTGSILVKEVFNGGTLDLYSVMQKSPSNANAGSGWVWAEYDTDGTAITSVISKGTACVGCHSSAPNRDLVKTFDLH